MVQEHNLETQPDLGVPQEPVEMDGNKFVVELTEGSTLHALEIVAELLNRIVTEQERQAAILNQLLVESREVKVVWSVNVGDIRELLLAPMAAFGEPVLEKLRKELPLIINGTEQLNDPEKAKGKIISIIGK